MDSNTFLRELNAACLARHDSAGKAKKTRGWTRHMSRVLHDVAAANDLGCCCKYTDAKTAPHHHHRPKVDPAKTAGMHREYLFDFTWYRTWKRYEQPAVIIEHENQWNRDAFMLDFWKLSLGLAPLRVMFGYTRSEDDWVKWRGKVNRTIEKRSWVFPAGSEDLVLLGHRGMAPDDFGVMFRTADQRVFSELSPLADHA